MGREESARLREAVGTAGGIPVSLVSVFRPCATSARPGRRTCSGDPRPRDRPCRRHSPDPIPAPESARFPERSDGSEPPTVVGPMHPDRVRLPGEGVGSASGALGRSYQSARARRGRRGSTRNGTLSNFDFEFADRRLTGSARVGLRGEAVDDGAGSTVASPPEVDDGARDLSGLQSGDLDGGNVVPEVRQAQTATSREKSSLDHSRYRLGSPRS